MSSHRTLAVATNVDMAIECKVCRRPFVWDVGEQHFYATHRLCPPRRCKACRASLKQHGQLHAGGRRPPSAPPTRAGS